MVTIDSLANETLYDIMEMLKPTDLPLWDSGEELPSGSYDSLRAAALVCSRWRDPAQRALFNNILIGSNDSLRHHNFIASPARPRYRARSLEVMGRSLTKSGWLDVARATQGLEKLSIQPSSDCDSEVFSDPCFAGLKTLRLSCPETFQGPVDAAAILAMRLESLSLWLYEANDVPPTSPAFIASLFAASSASLLTLHLKIYDNQSETSIIPSFHLVAASLRTLILESAYDVLEGHLDLLSACTSLEHLALQWDDNAYDTELNIRNIHSTGSLHIKAILKALPRTPTLRHLSLDMCDPLDLVPIVPVLEYATFNLLEILEFPRMDLVDGTDAKLPRRLAGELEAVGQALLSMRDLCEHRGIKCLSSGKYCVWEMED
ncbi:hypothetical protein RQP46_002922 [Phenoliferia psychrophenolica]